MKQFLFVINILFILSCSIFAQDDRPQLAYHLKGTILDESSQPVSKTQVCFSASVYVPNYFISLAARRLGCYETDEQGRYELSATLIQREYTISAEINSLKMRNHLTGADELLRKLDYQPVLLDGKNKKLEINFTFPDKAEAAAKGFYQAYVENFSLRKNSQLEKLRPYLSSNLYSLLKREAERQKAKAKLPPNQTQIEDFFSCNHHQLPLKFFIDSTSQNKNRYSAELYFTYIESFIYPPASRHRKEIVNSCGVIAEIIKSNGNWVIDDVRLWNKPNLKEILKLSHK